MRVIGAGFGRTGTTSLKAALEQLGFAPCYHMQEVIKNPSHVSFWNAAARGEAVDWRGFFEPYGATVDWPACTFYQQLMAVYPDAKVLLSVRDPERWYESVMSTIYPSSTTESDDPNRQRHMAMVDSVVWNSIFGRRLEDKEHTLRVFADHLAEVQRSLPAERLLLFEARDGWEPLCAFLGVPVPNEPYPRLNDRASFLARRAKEAGSATGS